MISFHLPGGTLKEVVKALSSLSKSAGIEGSEEGVLLWTTAPGRSSTAKVHFFPETSELEVSRPGEKKKYGFSLVPLLAVLKVVKSREVVSIILYSDSISVKAKGLSVRILPTLEVPPRPEDREPESYVKIPSGILTDLLRVTKGAVGKEGTVRISLGPEGLSLTSKGEEATVEMHKEPNELSEVGGGVQLTGTFLISPLLSSLKAVPPNYITTVGMTSEGVLIISFSPGAAMGSATFFFVPLTEEG